MGERREKREEWGVNNGRGGLGRGGALSSRFVRLFASPRVSPPLSERRLEQASYHVKTESNNCFIIHLKSNRIDLMEVFPL